MRGAPRSSSGSVATGSRWAAARRRTARAASEVRRLREPRTPASRAAPAGSTRGCAARRIRPTPSAARGRRRRRRAARRRPWRRSPARSVASARRKASWRSRPAPASSRIANSGSSPAVRAWTRSSRAQKPWKVPIGAPSVSRAASRSPSSSRRARTRSRSSAAARSVKVIARIRPGAMPSSRTARTKRSTSTEVLPLPAPAASSSGPRRRAAACSCSAVKVGAAGISTLRALVAIDGGSGVVGT